jgi:hypothetical protein
MSQQNKREMPAGEGSSLRRKRFQPAGVFWGLAVKQTLCNVITKNNNI